jgi:hypothetical protein
MDSLELQFGSSLMASGSAPWQYQVSDAAQYYAATNQLQAGYKRQRGPGSELQGPFSGGWCSYRCKIAAAWPDQLQIDAAVVGAVAVHLLVIGSVWLCLALFAQNTAPWNLGRVVCLFICYP